MKDLIRKQLHDACVAALDSMERQFPNGLPIQFGTLCEEEDWDRAIRLLRAAIDANAQAVRATT